MDPAALTDTLRRATADAIERATPLLPEHAHRLNDIELRFDLQGLSAGQTRLGARDNPEIRYNLAIARLQPADFVRETVPHEVAHVVTWLLHGRRVRPHGPEWQAVMRHLGIKTPRRCHDFDMPPVRRQRRWPYRCACRVHQLSTTRHRRMQQQGIHYHCRACGTALEALEP